MPTVTLCRCNFADEDAIRCETPPRYAPDGSFASGGHEYRAIADHAGQPAGEPRHCAATPPYQSLTADDIAVFEPTERAYPAAGCQAGNHRGDRGPSSWLLLYWNVYYRTLVPIYVRRRHEKRRRNPGPRPISWPDQTQRPH